MTEIINTIIPFLNQNRYIFAFLGSLFEGLNIMLVCGFLYKLGIFKFWNILIVLIAGYILNGYFWYGLGRFGGRSLLEKWGPKFFLTKERMLKIEKYFKKHTIKALILTRITYGIGGYVFAIAGIFKTKAKKFFWCNFIASVIWVVITFALGYSFGISYDALDNLVKTVAVWAVVVLFILFIGIAILLVYWIRKKAKARFLEKTITHKKWETIKRTIMQIGKLFNNKE